MKIIFFLTAVFLVVGIQSVSCSAISTDTFESVSRFFFLRRAPSCNTNVCFVIDGTTDISADYFEDQKKLIKTITALLKKKRGEKKYAAVEYGTSTYVITPFIDNRKHFIDIIGRTSQVQSREPYLTGGINYCFSLLERQETGDRVIVIIGSGRNTIGSSPVERAKKFVQRGGKIVSVGIGERQDLSTLKALAGENDGISVKKLHRIKKSAKKASASICK